jgi:hypothetical protein
MARVVVTDDQWASARLTWESEPLKTHADVGKILGISKQAVQKKANKDGWQKRITLAQAAERAHQVADNINVTTNAGALSKASPLVVAAPGNFSPAAGAVAVDEAVAKRAEVLDRQRKEVAGPRNMALIALRDKDLSLGRLAKAAADTLKSVHEMERKAWGFPADDAPPVTIVVGDRGYE